MLLGYYREGSNLGWDDDIDIVVKEEDINKLKDINWGNEVIWDQDTKMLLLKKFNKSSFPPLLEVLTGLMAAILIAGHL